MHPTHYHHLPTSPDPNGKLDRNAHPTPTHPHRNQQPLHRAAQPGPKSDRRRLEAGIARRQGGPDDHFFELGGDSLLTIRVHAQPAKGSTRTCRWSPSCSTRTVRSLARHLAGAGGDGGPKTDRVTSSGPVSNARPRPATQSWRDGADPMSDSGPTPTTTTFRRHRHRRDVRPLSPTRRPSPRSGRTCSRGRECITRFAPTNSSPATGDMLVRSDPNYVRARGVLSEPTS